MLHSEISYLPCIDSQYHRTTHFHSRGQYITIFNIVIIIVIIIIVVVVIIIVVVIVIIIIVVVVVIRYIANLFTDVPFPTPRRPRVQMQIGPESIVFSLPIRTPLPMGYDIIIDCGWSLY